MTREDVIRMARQVGFPMQHPDWQKAAEEFSALVAEAEHEACAKLVEDSWMAFSRPPNHRLDLTPFPELSYVAKVIRARGQQ